jgi:hypothetical protein
MTWNCGIDSKLWVSLKKKGMKKLFLKSLFPWKLTTLEGELVGLESSLGSILRRVDPREEFEGSLRRGLLNHAAPAEVEMPSRTPRFVLAGVAGLLSGVVIIILGVWVIMILTGRWQVKNKRTAGLS